NRVRFGGCAAVRPTACRLVAGRLAHRNCPNRPVDSPTLAPAPRGMARLPRPAAKCRPIDPPFQQTAPEVGRPADLWLPFRREIASGFPAIGAFESTLPWEFGRADPPRRPVSP